MLMIPPPLPSSTPKTASLPSTTATIRNAEKPRAPSTCAFADRVATLSITTYKSSSSYSSLPLSEQKKQTCLSTIVAHIPVSDELHVLSIGSGTKFLTCNIQDCDYDWSVSDMHAEVLARRGFCRWLCEEIIRCVDNPNSSSSLFIEDGEKKYSSGRWRLKAGVTLHLYCSSSPCGDSVVRKWQKSTRDQRWDCSDKTILWPKVSEKGQGQVHPVLGVHAFQHGQFALLCKGTVDNCAANEIDGKAGDTNADTNAPLISLIFKEAINDDNTNTNKIRELTSTETSISSSKSDKVKANANDKREPAPPGTSYPSSSSKLTTKNTTLSHTCSDKILLWNYMGLQGKFLHRYVGKLFLSTVIVGRKYSKNHCIRAFCCRGVAVVGKKRGVGTNNGRKLNDFNHVSVMSTAINLDDGTVGASAGEGAEFTAVCSASWASGGKEVERFVERINGLTGKLSEGGGEEEEVVESESRLCRKQMRAMHREVLDTVRVSKHRKREVGDEGNDDEMDTLDSDEYFEEKSKLMKNHPLFVNWCWKARPNEEEKERGREEKD